MKRITKNNGSAMMWAVFALLLLTIVVAASLTISMSYYSEARDAVAMEKAELLAQSGANYAVECMSIDDDADIWLRFDESDYDLLADGYDFSADEDKILPSPFRVYFDNSIEETLESWLETSGYGAFGYSLDGTDVSLNDTSIPESVKQSVIKSNKSQNYAVLSFEMSPASDPGNDDAAYILKVTSVSERENYRACCSAAFSCRIRIVIIDEFTGAREVRRRWDFLGFIDS